MSKSEFERAIERQTGLTVEQIKEMPLGDMRKLREKQFGRPMQIIGSTLMRLLSKQDVEKLVDEALL